MHGNGGGGFYPFYALDGREHGKRCRRILVDKIQGPFSAYHAHLQYCRGEAEMEVAGSSNVAIYGIKNDIDSVALWVRDSRNVLMTGYGGPGETPETGKLIVERSADVVLANLIHDSRDDRADARNPMARIVTADGRSWTTVPFDRPVVFKATRK
ncbi:MAG: hypothetical protein KatS3mg005_3581 [Bryobacteraceae bacterium]|nr:MAG: hypothetical protein KatS3mg005_3581 [Bryobacteraceae bacterium]